MILASARQKSRQAMECLEVRLKQLEQAIQASETQERCLWTAVHQALNSIGERIQEMDLQLKDSASTEATSVLVLKQDCPGPTFSANRVCMREVATDMLQKHSRDWEHRFVVMQ